MSDSVIVIGVVVQVMTLIGIVFTMGRFTGRTTNIIEDLQRDLSELKLDVKTHFGQDVASFRDLTKDINELKISIERIKP